MSDSDDFPKLHNDGDTSESEMEDNSEENESENSENSSECEEQISASNLVEALREAGKNTIRFDNISECDRLEDDFLIDAFKTATSGENIEEDNSSNAKRTRNE